jgi:hypothetical protein
MAIRPTGAPAGTLRGSEMGTKRVAGNGKARGLLQGFSLALGLAVLSASGAVMIAAPVPASAQSETMDFARANTCELLRAYVAEYPNGRHISEARTALRSKNCRDPAAETQRLVTEAQKARLRQKELEDQLAEERRLRALADQRARDAIAKGKAGVTTAPRVTGTDVGAFGLDLLHPDVRAKVVEARAAAVRAEAAAGRARASAQSAEEAAGRARSGAANTKAENISWGSPQVSARYETEVSGGVRSGYGIRQMTSANEAGDRYAGQWAQGKFWGLGVASFGQNPSNTGNSLRYEGEFADDRYNGLGTFVWRSGHRSAGSYKTGQMEGPGVYYFASGSRYEGDHRDGKEHGLGVMWTANGTVSQAGEWQFGRLVRALADQRARDAIEKGKAGVTTTPPVTATAPPRDTTSRSMAVQVTPVMTLLQPSDDRRSQNGGSALVLLTTAPSQAERNTALCSALYTEFDTADLQDIETGVRRSDGAIQILRPIYWFARTPTVPDSTGASGCQARLSNYHFARANTLLKDLGLERAVGPLLAVVSTDGRSAGVIDLARTSPDEIVLWVRYFREVYSRRDRIWAPDVATPDAVQRDLIAFFGTRVFGMLTTAPRLVLARS